MPTIVDWVDTVSRKAEPSTVLPKSGRARRRRRNQYMYRAQQAQAARLRARASQTSGVLAATAAAATLRAAGQTPIAKCALSSCQMTGLSCRKVR